MLSAGRRCWWEQTWCVQKSESENVGGAPRSLPQEHCGARSDGGLWRGCLSSDNGRKEAARDGVCFQSKPSGEFFVNQTTSVPNTGHVWRRCCGCRGDVRSGSSRNLVKRVWGRPCFDHSPLVGFPVARFWRQTFEYHSIHSRIASKDYARILIE